MATTVQVLCPNGRRQNVKVSPNTKVLQVLEEVCTKQAFLPSDEYILNHGRKTLDLTLALRFTSLPNNAKLELVKAPVPRSQKHSDVTIALQLENGERLQHTFQPSTTLWQILEHWESQDGAYKEKLTLVDGSKSPPLHPVCIYMREEVIGESALKDMTLKKLALTSGKAIIRLVHRSVDDSTLADILDKLEKEKLKQAKLAQKALEAELSESNISTSSTSSQHDFPVDTPPKTSSTADMTQEKDSTEKAGLPKSSSEEEKVAAQKKTLVNDEEPVDEQDLECGKSPVKDAGASAAQYGSNVDSHTVGVSAADPSAIEQLRRMNIPGIEIITLSDFNNLSAEEQQMGRMLAENIMPGLVGRQQQAATRKPKTSPRQPFAEFKFPEETKGKTLYQNELSEVKPEEFRPCDRDVVVFNSNEETSKAIVEEPPEDFFQVTEADVKMLFRDLKRQADSERPLTTEAMRQAELEERHQQYEYVIIRVRFRDGLVLQGCFRPRETVFALHKFVKEHLEDKEQEFYLFRSPPKEILSDKAQTLTQANLAPSTLLYFGSRKKEEEAEHSLARSVMMDISPFRRAEELSVKKLAKKQIEILATEGIPSACSSSSSEGGNTASGARGSNSADQPTRPAPRSTSGASGEPKVPKWLKMGKR